MNNEAKIQIGRKQGEERNPDRFLERNDDGGQRRALISLLFLSLSLSLSLSILLMHGNKGWRHREGRQLRVWRGVGYCSRGYCSAPTVVRSCPPINFKKNYNCLIRTPNASWK